MTAYFDNNILIYIENGSLSVSDLKKRIDNKLTDFVYSSAHIQETEEIKGETNIIRNKRIQKRLRTIEKVTNSKYLFHDLSDGKVYLQVEKPEVVLSTIGEVPFGNKLMKSLINLISENEREKFRLTLGLNSIQLNNYKPGEVIKHLNKKLVELGNLSFIELIEKGVELHPQGKEFGLNNRFAGIFELLDLLGYWTDKYTEKSNYARLWDSKHAYFASFCDYFISNDKRTRNKTKVVYDIYGIETKIVTLEGIII